MALTDTWLRTAKATDRPFKKSDAGGLYVLVRPDGKLGGLGASDLHPLHLSLRTSSIPPREAVLGAWVSCEVKRCDFRNEAGKAVPRERRQVVGD
jgi:hypothetical protein